MGDKVAAHFAQALKVPPGWMDSPRTEQEVRDVVASLNGTLAASVHAVAPAVSGARVTDLGLRLAVEFASLPDGDMKRQLFDQLLEQIHAAQQGSQQRGKSSLLQQEDDQTRRDTARAR